MKGTELTVTVNCELDISKETAETCLQLVEYFINTHKGFYVQDKELPDGTVMLFLQEYPEEE